MRAASYVACQRFIQPSRQPATYASGLSPTPDMRISISAKRVASTAMASNCVYVRCTRFFGTWVLVLTWMPKPWRRRDISLTHVRADKLSHYHVEVRFTVAGNPDSNRDGGDDGYQADARRSQTKCEGRDQDSHRRDSLCRCQVRYRKTQIMRTLIILAGTGLAMLRKKGQVVLTG